jgi:YVTN family beta-propeller protein
MTRPFLYLIPAISCLVMLPLSEATTPATGSSQGMLLVAERPRAAQGGQGEAEGVIGIVDPETGKEVAAIPEGGIIAHMVTVAPPDSNIAFVPIYGTGGVGNQGNDGSKISVIDLEQKKVIDSIDFGHGARPHEIFYNPKDGLLYVTTEIDYALTVVDPKTRKIVGTVPTGQPESHDFVFSPDGKRAYTVNVFAGTISVLDLVNRKLVAIVPVVTDGVGGAYGPGSAFRKMMVQRISISPDGRTIYTQDQRHQALAVLDTKSLKVTGSVPLPERGLGSAVTPDGHYVIAAGGDQVTIVDVKTMQVVKSIPTPKTPQEIFIRPDGQIAYVTVNNAPKVVAIRISDWTVDKLLDIGDSNSEGMAWWSAGK